MDSMRSLNTSLPPSTPHRNQPPEQLLQAFKTAALSVTNLYKNAVSEQGQARQAGYQDALEDLVSFLDKEHLGLGDGEGWKIRQWATERIDGTGAASSDTDDDRGDIEKDVRSSSPVIVRKEAPDVSIPRQQSRSTSPPRTAPTTQKAQPVPATEFGNTASKAPTFTFTAGPQFPQQQPQQTPDVDMQPSDATNIAPNAPTIEAQTPISSNVTTPSVRVEVVPRGTRTPHRHNNSSRHNARSSTREPGPGTGSKRKFHFGEFFDISSIGNGKEGPSGGKRGRFI
ncbi:hypothetical protein FQN54_000498 [Arachnomyces sp. PD_36]|nr:hypothetical protein FQN54_000498 [Arachnomyces sp. PD_36]